MSGNSYLDILFDTERPGFIDVSEKILSYLDYHSFVWFKRSCRFVYNFLEDRPNLEKSALRRKLSSDWTKMPKIVSIPTAGPVAFARLFDDGRHVACAVNQDVQVFEISTGNCKLVLTGPHIAAVSGIEIIYNNSDKNLDDKKRVKFFVTGCREGVLAFWSPEGDLLVRKQLFGRIQSVKWKDRWLATSHFGKPFDAGCITIREIRSMEDMPVVFALYEDLFPVITMDFTDEYVASLEWNGTFNSVEAGNIFIYKWHEKVPVANLSQLVDCSFSTCRFVRKTELLTGSHDQLIRFWKVSRCPDSFSIECIRVFSAHQDIITRLEICTDRAVTRDKSGKIIVWDVTSMRDADKDATIQEISTPSSVTTSVALNERQLCIGLNQNIVIHDFWNK